ncbi:VOC family protein [Pedobacter sp. HMF7647]|uniref:VOC family protein n=1 Tax=Hufsiella arboris TaxID=2695275 RepID=A0A7K1Y8L1_9SPHI|nr:VOC family protein [Hufsiella arboris]MXV50932.1 VOC family protein [Hufsiella arboris]
MTTMNSYLNFPGTTEDAFDFYKSVFGGEFTALQRFKDTPGCENVAEADGGKIMHISLPIGNNILMATDALESMGQSLKVGTNISLSLNTDSLEEAERVFNALSQGANVTNPLQKMFWGAYWGMLTDRFDIQWMVNFDENQAS